jgi:ABC-2 type transport system ATP-binding protein
MWKESIKIAAWRTNTHCYANIDWFGFGRTMASSLVELQELTKRFRGVTALRDVSLSIPAGVTGLLGPNGAGKSTLIKILLGLIRATSGSGWLLGNKLGLRRSEIMQRVGYMPEDDCYIPGLTGIEAVTFAARMSRFPKVEAMRRAHEILDYCGAGQERYRGVETYSTGMRQKLKFAASLVHDPEFLILDEPTSGLDPEERVAMLRRIRQLAQDFGKGIMLCTHILPDVEEVGDHVVILAAGGVRISESMAVLRKPSRPQVEVQVDGDCAVLARIAESEGVPVTLGLGNVLMLSGDVDKLMTRIWGWAHAEGISLTRVAPAHTSLQEVFLAAVQDQHHAAA